MSISSQTLRDTVQHNCDITDARFASDYTLCIYLLKMREFYRWEKGFRYSDALNKEDVGQWLREREALWDSLEESEYRPLLLENAILQPFESEQINEQLLAQGLVYSGGIGGMGKPHFFLAELERRDDFEGHTILVSGKELARDLTAPPGMTQGRTIYIRRESLRRSLWERIENWKWNRPQNAMARGLSYFDIENQLEQSLDQITEQELESVVDHEIGEIMAGERLGEVWHEMLAALPRSRTEFMARAVRDQLADSLSTLPKLLEEKNDVRLHFYIANLIGMRKEMNPGMFIAYDKWLDNNDLGPLLQLVDTGRQHWLEVARKMLATYEKHGKERLQEMEALLASSAM